jgi:hypothetical protein
MKRMSGGGGGGDELVASVPVPIARKLKLDQQVIIKPPTFLVLVSSFLF